VTIYDITEKARVSPATVSRVLNNKNNANFKTRKDVEYGISTCVDHLKNKGHGDIVFVKDTVSVFASERKLEGYKKRMEYYGLPISDNNIFECASFVEDGYEIIDKITQSGVKFSAIIFCNDAVAFRAAKKLIEIGRKIPDDVAITGFNNSIFSKYMTQTLTTLDNKFKMMSIFATQLLIGLIEGRNVNSDLLIKPNLIIRQST